MENKTGDDSLKNITIHPKSFFEGSVSHTGIVGSAKSGKTAYMGRVYLQYLRGNLNTKITTNLVEEL